jgi:hypothetical protein
MRGQFWIFENSDRNQENEESEEKQVRVSPFEPEPPEYNNKQDLPHQTEKTEIHKT